MSIKDDILEAKEEIETLKKRNGKSLALEILQDLKRDNKTLKVLLTISILVNIAIALILR